MRSNKLLSRGENTLSIPIDLIIEIFLRLPTKSIARCRCVSKLWASLIGHQDFTELFFTKSSARPQLLFACGKINEVFFFSAHQPQNPDKTSSVVIANHLANFPFHSQLSAPVNGFCFSLTYKRGVLEDRICNPSTGQSLILPKRNTWRKIGLRSYIGYDPIKKQFKVLSMTWLNGDWKISEEHQVMTVGSGAPSWRMIECCIPHYPGYVGSSNLYNGCNSEICINGVLYYKARVNTSSHEDSMIVCFDFKSEKINVIKVKEISKEIFYGVLPHTSALINYNGKLGLLMRDRSYYDTRRNVSFELWVQEDNGKHEWSKHIYVLPTLWSNVIRQTELYFVGIIGTNEIVLSPLPFLL